MDKITTNNLKTITMLLKEHRPEFKEKFKVKEIGIFGSYLRREQKKTSDLDLLVEFDEPVSFFDFIRLENELTKLLGIKVDLVMKESLKPRLRERVIKEAQYI